MSKVEWSNHRLRMVSLSFDFAQDSEPVELSNHESSPYVVVGVGFIRPAPKQDARY